jgi:hypothetical protein
VNIGGIADDSHFGWTCSIRTGALGRAQGVDLMLAAIGYQKVHWSRPTRGTASLAAYDVAGSRSSSAPVTIFSGPDARFV